MNIAKELGRSASTIGHELKRNSTPRGYDPARAQRQYEERRQACRPKARLTHAPLLDYVKAKICDEEWTPVTIRIGPPLDFPDDPDMRVSHQTLYRALYTRHDLG